MIQLSKKQNHKQVMLDDAQKEDQILNEMSELSDEIIDNISIVIEAEWDAPTLQKKIAAQVAEYQQMRSEFSDLFDQRDKEYSGMRLMFR